MLRGVNLADTIAAIATAPGEGAVAMVRVSGARARVIAEATFRPTGGGALRPRRLAHGHVISPATGAVIDEAMAAWMPAPRTYTREPVLEVTCHGGRAATAAVLQAILAAGARLAEPGEFTLRAFVNGRIDLAQAEAVRDAVAAPSADAVATAVAQAAGALSRAVGAIRDPLADLAAALEASLDFADDGVPDIDRMRAGTVLRLAGEAIDDLLATAGPGRVRRHGLRVALAGATNAGKSTLFNALVGSPRAIVSDEAGTTRDTIEEVVAVGGTAIVLIDTAGWRSGPGNQAGTAERLGLERTEAALAEADAVVHVIDGTDPGMAPTGRARLATLCADPVPVVEAWTRADLTGSAPVVEAWALDAVATQGVAGGTGARPTRGVPPVIEAIRVSALTGEGIDVLRARLHALAVAGGTNPRTADRTGGEVVTNARHVAAIQRAREAITRGSEVVSAGLPDDLLAADLRASVAALGEITGETVGEDVLSRVFRTFCIGK